MGIENELVCIGVDIDKEKILAELNAAVLTDEEMGSFPEGWLAMEDPFFGEHGKNLLFRLNPEHLPHLMG